MKKVVRINESELRHMIMESIKRVLNESKPHKLQNSFKSKEDMTQIRDKYAPEKHTSIYDTDNTYYDGDVKSKGEWGSGPYADYKETCFGDGYDYCGDDDHNDMAGEYNSALHKKLATKGGQMADDWERFAGQPYPEVQKRHEMDRAFDSRRKPDWSDRAIERGKKHMNNWLRYKDGDPGEHPFDRMETSIYR